MRVRRTNCALLLPGGATARADRQPASTERLERAGLLGVGNAHLFFLDGAHEPALGTTLTVTHKRQGGAWTLTELPLAGRPTYTVRDVDTWDGHTEVLAVEAALPGLPDPAFKTETWTRIRLVKTGAKRPSGLEVTTEERTPVELSFVGERGDSIGDRTLVNAEVVAVKGTLADNDKLVHETRGFYEVVNVVTFEDAERGILRG